MQERLTAWQQWLQHPERSRVRNAVFQIHLSVGAGASIYIFLMSVSGSVIVYRNELSRRFSIEWLVNLHENLLAGSIGRFVNGIGAVCVTALCLTGAVIWWPGIKNWRRSLTVNWRANFGRINWDLHSALGFWCFLFVVVWGMSGIYFSFPRPFNGLSSSIPPTVSPTKACSGCPSCTLADSAGLQRLFGVSRDWRPPSWHSPAFSFAAAG